MNMLAQARTQSATLMSDVGGEINAFAVEMREDWFGDADKRAAIATLIKSLSANDAKVTVVARESNATGIDTWMKGLKTPYEIVRVPNNELASKDIWARDAVLVVTDDNGALRFVRPCVVNTGEWHKWLATHLAAPLDEVSICLEGGDSIMAREHLWLVGATAVKFTMKKWNVSWSQAIERIKVQIGNGMLPTIAGYRLSDLSFSHQLRWLIEQQKLNREKLHQAQTFGNHILGRLAAHGFALVNMLRDAAIPLKQHWAHIDLVVSVTGVLDGTKPIVLVAKPCPTGCKPGSDAEAQDQRLDSLAKVLTENGCKVIRNPAPYVESRILPYNNTILQTNPRRVWLPGFGDQRPELKATDDENAGIWTKLGFDVVRIPGWYAFVQNYGSIRCWTLPFRRKAGQ